jgi:hypothetical protein
MIAYNTALRGTSLRPLFYTQWRNFDMIRFLKTLSFMGLALATPLFAHSGDHYTVSISHFTVHLLSILMMAAVPTCLAYTGYKISRKFKTQKVK